MNWKRRLILLLTKKSYRDFIADTKHPGAARTRLWKREILPLLRQSAYWSPILHSYTTDDLDHFAITTYDTYKEGLESARHGRIQPFNGEEVIFWSETSGTSGERKFFPITKSFQTQFQRTIPPFLYIMAKLYPQFMQEKLIYLVAINPNKTTPSGTPIGWVSNFNYRNLPSFIKLFYAMPNEVLSHGDIYTEWGPLYALSTDLSALFSVTPMVIDLLYERCVKKFHFYLPYLLGEKPLPNYLPPLKISKKRQAYLRELSNKSNPTFKELWPTLKPIVCWISGLCEYPASQLLNKTGEGIELMEGAYSATEGWITVPIDSRMGSILHPGAHIVEFIEEGKEIIKENLLQSWDLEIGKKYEVFLTTAMGLVRYRLHDVVKCTDYWHKAPRLEFCYKAQLLKLEYCAITAQELQQMVHDVNFHMEEHWYFARNSVGNRVVLVTDDTIIIPDSLLEKMHQRLKQLNHPYAHGVVTREVLPMALLQLPKAELLSQIHAQFKPRFISYQVATER